MKEIFPDRYSILLVGPPGVGKQEYCIDLANYYLKKGDNVVLVSTEISPEDMDVRGRSIGIDLSSFENNLFHLDCYSWSLRTGSLSDQRKKNLIRISGLENLNEIIVKMEKIVSSLGGKSKVIFHSLSPFFLYNDGTDVIKFFQLLTSRLKEDGCLIFASIQEGVHSPSTLNTLRYLVDGTLEMKFVEGDTLGRQIRVHHLKDVPSDTSWRLFTIDKGGIKIRG